MREQQFCFLGMLSWLGWRCPGAKALIPQQLRDEGEGEKGHKNLGGIAPGVALSSWGCSECLSQVAAHKWKIMRQQPRVSGAGGEE